MKVFVSWSGERSQSLAIALREWLQLALHYVKPWLSEHDVAAGDRWAQEIAKELEASNFGIICLTPENITSPWVLFEAGALAKSLQGSKVIPLLFDLEFSDITGPLAQFQAKKFDKTGVSEVIQSINHTSDQKLPDERLKQLFVLMWPDLEKKLTAIPDEAPGEKHMRPQHEILEELVTGVRGLDSQFRRLEETVEMGRGPRKRLRRRMHPMMFDEMAMLASEDPSDPIGLLIFGSLIRDDVPWLYEAIVDAYRELKSGDGAATQRAIARLRKLSKMIHRGPYLDLMMDDSKESHILALEFPMMLDRVLHRLDSHRDRDAPETGDDEEAREP